MQGILYNFKAFIGANSGHLIVFLISMCICAFMAHKRAINKYIAISFAISALIIFNPLFYRLVGERFLSGVYWRLFWIIPMGMVVAFVFAGLVGIIKGKWGKIFAIFILILCLAMSGELVISRDNYSFAQNPYQLSETVIKVCDSILADNGDEQTMAIMPYEFLTEVRQYTSRIGLLYGRNVDGYITQITKEEQWAYRMMSESEIDFETLRILALSKNVDYIVFNDTYHQYNLEDIEQYGYNLVEKVEEYSIYRISEE